MVFQDSDAYKWLEAAAYVLATNNDKALKKHNQKENVPYRQNWFYSDR